MDNMAPEELGQTLESIFLEADTNGDGTLDRDEFRSCLEKTELALGPEIIDALADKVFALSCLFARQILSHETTSACVCTRWTTTQTA